MKVVKADWSIFDSFTATMLNDESHTWSHFDRWIDLAREAVGDLTADRDQLVSRWDHVLEDLGGDPARSNWSDFRPLRLSREEAWSDWLAHLLATSPTGKFASLLFGVLPNVSDFSLPMVKREERTEDGDRRADLVITWRNGVQTHVEVKIWDQNFEKTFDTAVKLEGNCHTPGNGITHFILVPPQNLGQWRGVAIAAEGDESPTVFELTWFDVAAALRASIRFKEEKVPWRAWAWSFTGAVEQKILGCPSLGLLEQKALGSLAILNRIAQQADLMRRGLEDAQET